MRVSRFYCTEPLNANKKINLDKEATHYIKNVLRHKMGDELIVFNQQDGEFEAVISNVNKAGIQIQTADKLRDAEEPVLNIHLGQGVARGEKMDFIIQKATVGTNITQLTPSRGFAAQLATASTVIFASGLGLPVSTTQTLVGAILGVGFARGIGALNIGVIRNILMSWVITLPAGAVLSIVYYYLIKEMFV